MAILAIDQGTTSTKAFVLHEDGRFESIGQLTHAQFHDGAGLVEQDADELAGHVEQLVDQAITGHAELRGVVLANQGETVVAWDRQGKHALARAIVWQDQRTQGWLDGFDDTERRLVQDRAGLPLDAYFSASKLSWLLANVPGVAAAREAGTLGIGTSDSFFLDRLTGSYVTDVTTASRTSLMNLSSCAWDEVLCGLFRVPHTLLPAIQPTTAPFGMIRRYGKDVPLLVSIVDQQAALFGHGCRLAGEAKITVGTGSFALALSGEAPALDREGLVPTVAWQLEGAAPVYALDAGDYTATAALDWAMRVGIGKDLASFDLAAEAPSALEAGLVFVPALAGLAAPYWDREAPAVMIGMDQSTSIEHMRRAVLEGIALRAVELLEVLGVDHRLPVSIDGGLSRNGCFVQFLADALGRPLRRQSEADLTALGAAEMGYVALGLPIPPREVATSDVINPSPRSAAIRARLPLFAATIALGRQWAVARKASLSV
jgi:glycerol kinase